jgi:hypothetical protein
MKYKVSFLLNNSLNFPSLEDNFDSINSLKNNNPRMYKRVAPIVNENRTKKVPNHFPNINPPAKAISEPTPKSNTQIIEKKKKINETIKIFCSLNLINIF